MKTPVKAPHPLTLALKRLIEVKGIDRISLHVIRDPSAESWSDACIFEVRVSRKAGGIETVSTLEIPGRVSNGSTSAVKWHTYEGRKWQTYAQPFRPETGFWSLFGAQETFVSAVRALPKNCAPAFHVSLDGLTTEGHTKVGMHGDSLKLEARADSTVKAVFLIDTNTGPHNSARFGSPKHDEDRGIYREREIQISEAS